MSISQPQTVRVGNAVEAMDHGLRRLVWLEQKRLSQVLAVHALTIPQFFVLLSLVHRNNGCTIGDLAGHLFQSNATMTGIIDRLEVERLVSRTRGGEIDRRKVTVHVTPKGRQLLERADHARQENLRQALSHFAPDDLRVFLSLLSTYLDALEMDN